MNYTLRDTKLEKVGVVGSGQIGPDIALYFTKVLHAQDVQVMVVDIVPEALRRGEAKLVKKVEKGREAGAFTEEMAERMREAVVFTSDYGQLTGAGLVIEAATEDLGIKQKIFTQLEDVCSQTAVLASNSSHIEPEAIFAGLRSRERALVIHYFFPAERNPLVEVVPAGETDPQITDEVMAFYEAIGKVPVRVGGRYGYAVNPVFEGLFLAAALAVEGGLGTTREVDAAARRALGLGIGPFTAMNLTGGNPITAHALDVMTEKLGPWFRVPALLSEAMQTQQPWDVGGRGDPVELPPDREQRIADTMLGAYFGLAGQILDSGIITLSDLEMAIELGLVVRPPFAFMNELSVDGALTLVEAYAAEHPGFEVPRCLAQAARAVDRRFQIDQVIRRDAGDVAVLTIRRPRVLNALSEGVYEELLRHFTALRDEPAIEAVVLTGFGPKSFVSGADVHFLAQIETPQIGFTTSQRSKEVGNLIESLGKPVVCALNGFALGGGCEIALCCTERIARKGLTLALAVPEANLGIVPGAGATQRLPRLVGLEIAAEMLRTGRGMSGKEGVERGVIREEVEGDVVEAAVVLARSAARGEVELTPLDPLPLETPDELPLLDLGHLSRVTDALICRAILEGCRMPLADGLRFESEMFGACCATEDMRIGVQNFIANGPRSKASFVHR